MLAGKALQEWIDKLLPPEFGTHIGARKGTQTAKIPTALHILLAKSQDYGVKVLAAQLDALQHYDSVDILRILKWLAVKGAPPARLQTVAFFQMLPTIELSANGTDIKIGPRSKGALTGTRVAGQLGRIPIEHTVAQVHLKHSTNGFHVAIPHHKAQ